MGYRYLISEKESEILSKIVDFAHRPSFSSIRGSERAQEIDPNMFIDAYNHPCEKIQPEEGAQLLQKIKYLAKILWVLVMKQLKKKRKVNKKYFKTSSVKP